ncbi:tRNA lysidine(34) synthetase TilS [Candidatus Poriferisodalis sp.]|uniref:tRNA lysidine(34) synthetase TilS n=1 Tax=Candidatus Poriferisodalis sp. TaxID=3101277 RepID=UPI003B52245A
MSPPPDRSARTPPDAGDGTAPPSSERRPSSCSDAASGAPGSSDEIERLVDRCTFGDVARPELVCAVSGGADSAALLTLACRFAQRNDSAATAVTAIHVDHGLRPAGAAEAAQVEALCGRLGAGFRVVQLDLAPGANLQARARDARHAAVGPDALLGHTADDQAETVLLHLLRGGALDALAAMRADRRPLLGLRRSETERVCELAGYEPIRDPSNADPRFWRSRVRHEVMPLLCDIAGRDVVPLLARGSALAATEADLLDVLAADIDPTSASELRSAPVALARRSIRAWLRTDHPPDARTVERVLEVARHTHRATEVGGGRRVTRSADRLRLES